MKINRRTLNDWKREKYFLPLSFFKKICRLAKLKEPSNIEIRPPFWSVRKAAKIGGKIAFQKYGLVGGSPEKRRQKWLEWWNKEGRFNLDKYFVAREIFRPQKNEELAEFVGIMLGDGGITKRQVIVTLNSKTDRAYSIFVKKLMERLFKIKPSVFYEKEESTVDIYISRTRLVSFCKSIGLKVGNKLKQGLDIPEWIKGNKELEISCIRGLMDTDGCFYNECHKINNKKYCYPRLSLVSHSCQLLDSVFEILQKLGFSPKIRNKRSVQLEELKIYSDISV